MTGYPPLSQIKGDEFMLESIFAIGALVFLLLTVPFVRWFRKESMREDPPGLAFGPETTASNKQIDSTMALSRPAREMVHEMKNTCSAAYGTLDLLLEKEQLSEKGQEMVARARSYLEQMDTTLNHLRAFARHPDARALKIVDVNDIIKRALEIAEAARKTGETVENTSIEVELQLSSVPPILCNPDALQSVFVNLILNAFEAMPCGGRLKVLTEEVDDYIRVLVSDTGEGIPSDTVQKIFEPFFTTKPKGMGLGLSVAHEIIKQHSGGIQVVDSQPGKGTTFEVKFPVAVASQVGAAIEPRGRRILVVDDDKSMLGLYEDFFSFTQNDITVCQSGREALEKVRREKFDIVLADLAMPEVSGFEIARAVKTVNPHTPVVLVTAFSNEELERTYRNRGFDALVTKPFEAKELLRTLAELSNN